VSDDHNPWAAPDGPLSVGSGHETSTAAGPMPPVAFMAVALGAFVALVPELFVTFGLGFAPGWANWGGRSIQWVWPVGMTTCLFVLMVTFGIGVAGLIGSALGFSRQGRLARPVVVGWLASWAALTALSCVLAYLNLHGEAVQMFPSGYNP
jgi:hypothetical protein